jgi:hypothetical protein
MTYILRMYACSFGGTRLEMRGVGRERERERERDGDLLTAKQ